MYAQFSYHFLKYIYFFSTPRQKNRPFSPAHFPPPPPPPLGRLLRGGPHLQLRVRRRILHRRQLQRQDGRRTHREDLRLPHTLHTLSGRIHRAGKRNNDIFSIHGGRGGGDPPSTHFLYNNVGTFSNPYVL